jgi:hypothetical protein
VPYAAFQGEIIFLVTGGRIETYRKSESGCNFHDNLLEGSPKFFSRIIGFHFKPAYNQSA